MLFYTLVEFPLGRILLAKKNKDLSIARFVRDESHLRKITETYKRKRIPLVFDENRFLLEKKLFSRLSEVKAAANEAAARTDLK